MFRATTMLDKTWAFLQSLRKTKVFYVDAKTGTLLEEVHQSVYGLNYQAEREVRQLRTLPRIICLCGSTRFKDAILAASERFTMGGNIVLAPNVFGREATDEGKNTHTVLVSEAEKALLDALHFRKIDLSDRVHVVNLDGYIGRSVHNEVRYAVENDKFVTFEHPWVIPWDVHSDRPISTRYYLAAVANRIEVDRGGREE